MINIGHKVGCAFFIIILFISLFPTPVSSAEPIGNDFTGNVFRDGANAPVGVEVRAEVDGTIYGRTGTSNPGTGYTVYFMGTEGDDPATPVKDGCVNGEVMVFWVEDMVCDDWYDNWQEGTEILGVPIPALTVMDLHYSSSGQPTLLKINEIMVDPEFGNEWVELYNPSGSSVDLTPYSLWKNDGNIPGVQILDLTGTVQAGGFLVIDLGAAPVLSDSGHDEIKLVWTDPGGTKAGGNPVVIDRVEYGSSSSGPDDTTNSNVEMNQAPLPSMNVSIELEPDGDDSDNPDSDFSLSTRPMSTPGYTNTQVQPIITVTSPPSGTTQADASFLIEWTDDDPDDNATIRLYRDDDDVLGGEIFICQVPQGEDSAVNSFLWDTNPVPIGQYFIKAVIDDGINPATYDYSEGKVAVVHPPDIYIVEPDGIGDTADEGYLVTWVDRDADDNATVTLYYDTDNISGGEMLMGTGPVPQGEDPDGPLWDSFFWNTTLVSEGDYFIKASIFDGLTAVVNYSVGIIQVRHPPSVFLLEPDGISDMADRSYLITWTDKDNDDDAMITLYYDNNTTGYDGVQIIANLSEDSMLDIYSWNTSSLPEGSQWYVYAEITDGTTTAFAYSSGTVTITHPPSIQLLEPDGADDQADRYYVIQWMDDDTDDNATIALYFDGDTNPGGEGLIGTVPQGEEPDGPGDFFVWNTTNIYDGSYFIKAVINDSHTAVYIYSTGQVTIYHNKEPEITVITPAQDVLVTHDTLITWIDDDPDDNATIMLYYDVDIIPGNETLIGTVPQGEDSVVDSFLWNISGVPSGTYYIKAVINDSMNPVEYDISSGRIIVNMKPSIDLIGPSLDVYENNEFLITWLDDDPDDNAAINLFYDVDDSPGGEHFICTVSEGEDGGLDSYQWDVSKVPSGAYFIKGEIQDGLNEVQYAYSSGRIIVNKEPSIELMDPYQDVLVNTPYLITWKDDDPDDDASITLYYDADSNPGDEHEITMVPQGEDSTLDYYLWDVSTVPDGTYYIKAEIHDGVNPVKFNYSAGKITIDNTPPPAPTLDAVDNLTGENLLHLFGQCEPSVWVDIYHNNGLAGTVVSDANGLFDLQIGLLDGLNWFHARATDEAGNTGEPSSVEKTFLDTTPPEAMITYISSTSRVQWRTVTFMGKGIDDSPIIGYDWQSDIDGNLGSSAALTTSSLSRGNHTISFRVRDVVGLWSEPVEVTIEVTENIAPVIHVGDDVEIWANETVFFSPQVLESDGRITLYEWDFDGDGVYDWSSVEGGQVYHTYTLPGTYPASIRATDSDGNTTVDSLIVTVKEIIVEEQEEPEEGFSVMDLLLLLLFIILVTTLILQAMIVRKMKGLRSVPPLEQEGDTASEEDNEDTEEPMGGEVAEDETSSPEEKEVPGDDVPTPPPKSNNLPPPPPKKNDLPPPPPPS